MHKHTHTHTLQYHRMIHFSYRTHCPCLKRPRQQREIKNIKCACNRIKGAHFFCVEAAGLGREPERLKLKFHLQKGGVRRIQRDGCAVHVWQLPLVHTDGLAQ